MNQSELNAPICGTGSPFTTSAELEQTVSGEAPVSGTRLLARAVILLAIHDLGAWCRKCAAGKCHCRQVRLSAIRFLRGEEMEGIHSTLSLWSEAAGWPCEKLSLFFSEGKEGIWIPFVIKLRSPYRRARRGASAPLEASVIDLLLAYRPHEKLEIFYEKVGCVPVGSRVSVGSSVYFTGPSGCESYDGRVPAVR